MAIPSLCFRSNTMTCPKGVIFQSDQTMIQRNGDNCGYIYNPIGLIYLGKPFNILPGEPVMIIPHQPDDMGPWKPYRTIFEDGRLLKCRDEETLVIVIENRCPKQVIRVTTGCSLAGILKRWGISHEVSFASDRQLDKIETYELIITLDDTDDEEDDNKNPGKLNVKPSKKCKCQQ